MSSSILYLVLTVSCLLSCGSSLCPPCKTIQDCSSGYLGSYNLVEENSPSCPEVEGFTGCLYQKNGSSEAFCFKAGPQEQCYSYNQETCASGMTADIDPDNKHTDPIDEMTSMEETTSTKETTSMEETTTMEFVGDIGEDEKIIIKGAVTVRPCLAENFPNLANMNELEFASLCCGESDCQNNAGCFQDEVSDTFKTYCQCFLGYYLDNSTSSLPMTGECHSMTTQDCSSTSLSTCYENEKYKLCPYCHVTDKTGSEDSIIGQYDSGEGTFDNDDPMVFIGKSSDCQEEYTGMFWYCWYDTMQEVVDLNQAYILVEETDVCEHWAYIYTPLACPFAQEP